MAEQFYTIRDVEELTGIPATALRFYDKRGLLVFVKRSPSGIRIFTDSDVEKIRMIQFLRNIDMPVNVISRFIGLMLQGQGTRNERKRMVESLLKTLEEEQLQLNEKIEAAHILLQAMNKEGKNPTALRTDSLKIPKKYQKFYSREKKE